MAASPSSAAAMSELEAPSSPVRAEAKSFVSHAATEDEDTRMMDASPDPDHEPGHKPARGKAAKSQGREKDGAGVVTGKIRHLKKEDGEPLWRKDIQYDFLKAVFDNERKVFTNSYETERMQCFADLYIDTMARSSKTSKVLRDKLLTDREAAKGMAMVCLLVNIGRMNTTLNFFPEMRAQLRTYHAIPSLQANQDPHAYKQLQDAPRLKSILKGGMEDRPEPNSLDKIKREDIPRTNPVNLLFIICQSASKIAELHFPPGQEFHDLVMKTNFSSESRARAFLWIMWFYLESDFTEEGCEENPFGPGVDYGVDVANQGVPGLEELTKEEEDRENVDTEAEREFGLDRQKMRKKIIEADHAYLADTQSKRASRVRAYADDGPAILPRIRPSKHESDMDSTRSTPPPRALPRSIGPSRRGGAALKYQIFEGSSPAGPSHQAAEGVVARKPRPPTAHQLAVERNRNQRVEYILDRGMRKHHHKTRKIRRADGAVFRAFKRVKQVQDPFEDSEDEDLRPIMFPPDKAHETFRERGFGGLALLSSEPDDFGEEVTSYGAAFRRAERRLSRWDNADGEIDVVQPIKKPKLNGVNGTSEGGDTQDGEGRAQEDENDERAQHKTNGTTNGDTIIDDAEDAEGAEEADKTGYGDASGGEEEDKEEDNLDEIEKGLLGLNEGESEVD